MVIFDFFLQQIIEVIGTSLQSHNCVITHGLDSGRLDPYAKSAHFEGDVLKFIAANPSEFTGVLGDEVSGESTDRWGSDRKKNRNLKKKG